MAEATALFNPNKGVTGRDGGPYLDEVEAREAEKRRAYVEGREPDLKNPPATAGIPLVTGPQLLHALNLNNNPSQEAHNSTASLDLVRADKAGEIPAEFNQAVEDSENQETETDDESEPTSDATTDSVDSGSGDGTAVNENGQTAPHDFPME